MRIWKKEISVESLTANHVGTAVAALGIEFLEVGDDFIRARVPVDERTRQPYGILHGGVPLVAERMWLALMSRPTARSPSGAE